MATLAAATSNATHQNSSSSEGKIRRRRRASPPSMYLWENNTPVSKPARPLIKIESSPAKAKHNKDRKRELAERFAAERKTKGKSPTIPSSVDKASPASASTSSWSIALPPPSSTPTARSSVSATESGAGRKARSFTVGPLFSLGGLRRSSSANAISTDTRDARQAEHRGLVEDQRQKRMRRAEEDHLWLHEQRSTRASEPTPAQVYAYAHAQHQKTAPLPPPIYPHPIHPIFEHYSAHLPPLPEASTPAESYRTPRAADAPSSSTVSFISSGYHYSDDDGYSFLTETDSEPFVQAALDRAPSVFSLHVTPSVEDERDTIPPVPVPVPRRSGRMAGLSLEIVEVERRAESMGSISPMEFAPPTPPPTPPGGKRRQVARSNASYTSDTSDGSADSNHSGTTPKLAKHSNGYDYASSVRSDHSVSSTNATSSTTSSKMLQIVERIREDMEMKMEKMRREMREEEMREAKARDDGTKPFTFPNRSSLTSAPTSTPKDTLRVVSDHTIVEEDDAEDPPLAFKGLVDDAEEDSDTETVSFLEQESALLAEPAHIGSALRTQLMAPHAVVAVSSARLRVLPPALPPPTSPPPPPPPARSMHGLIPPHVLAPPLLGPARGGTRGQREVRGPRGPLLPIPRATSTFTASSASHDLAKSASPHLPLPRVNVDTPHPRPSLRLQTTPHAMPKPNKVSRVVGEYGPDGELVRLSASRSSSDENELVGGPSEHLAETKKPRGWTGEWNQPDIRYVIAQLRDLR